MKSMHTNFGSYAFIIVVAVATGFVQANAQQDSVVERVATGFQFVEGPAWKDGVGLLFSDIRANKIHRWTEQAGVTTFLNHSDSSNGLTYDQQGRLVLTQMQLRRVARRDTNGTITPLATNFGGKRFNSPNDLVVKSDGSVWFTDPPFNVPIGEPRELTFAGIFRISANGAVRLLDSTLNLPNGICFSNDESKLYVNNSQAHVIYAWDIVNDSTINNRRVFATVPINGYADGMKFDPSGNLFCACGPAIWIFRPNGTLLDSMRVPESASNCTWGDSDRKTLFITAGTSLYKARLTTTDVEDHGEVQPSPFRLYQNFPNPFNPFTQIRFIVEKTGHASVDVFNSLGQTGASLFDGVAESGKYYNLRFDGSNLATGVYFYRLRSGDRSDLKKFVLMK